jgi:hypothetical protein
MVIEWKSVKESKIRCGSMNHLGRKAIKGVGGRVEALNLVASRNEGLKEQVVHVVVSIVNHMRILAILGRSLSAFRDRGVPRADE